MTVTERKSVSWYTPQLARDLPETRLAKNLSMTPKKASSACAKEKEKGVGVLACKPFGQMTMMPMLGLFKEPLQAEELMGWRFENVFRF